MLFYVGCGLIASMQPKWLQGSFDALMELFGRVGLRSNIGKTVGMIFQTFRAVRKHLDVDYKRRMMGEGMT